MLNFINSNGVLFSGVFSIITALIAAVVAIYIDGRKNRVDDIRLLKKELSSVKLELEQSKNVINELTSIKNAEKNIEKGPGSIYTEIFASGSKRNICGFCWEKEHIKIPIVVDIVYERNRPSYYSGYCCSCKTYCTENIEPDEPEHESFATVDEDADLPF